MFISYELAKELKDAGFPQSILEGSGYLEVDGAVPDEWRGPFFSATELGFDKRKLKIPTLSELIEACHPAKSDSFGLETRLDEWHCYYDYNGYFEHADRFKDTDGMYSVEVVGVGSTLEEAVARLYLALNFIKNSHGRSSRTDE